MLPLDRRAVLIAMGKKGTLTPEVAALVRGAPEQTVRWKLIEMRQPPVVLEAAGLPISGITLNRRRPSLQYVQRQIDEHLEGLGLDLVPVEFIHPHLAERHDLHEEWETQFAGVTCQWALHLFHHRVARIMALADYPAFRPLVNLIERGVHPYGLSVDGDRFWLVDPKADHDEVIREWDAAMLGDDEAL